MEQTEAWYTKRHKTQQSVYHPESIVVKCLGGIKQPVRHNAASHHDSTIDQENTPIRQ
jgi:hypothetical protein